MDFWLELLLELVGEPLLTAMARGLAATLPGRWRQSPWLAGFGYVVLGLLLGGLSAWLVPQLVIHTLALRLANLVISPLLCGFTLAAFGLWRRRHEKQPSVLDAFRYGALFGLTLQLVRWLALG